MRLNLGCGDWKLPAPWVNVDSFPGGSPNIVGTVPALPFPTGSAEAVYCGHVLEHIPWDNLTAALEEVRRVLQPGGLLCVVGPDLAKAEANREWWPLLPGIVEGNRRWPGDRHLWPSTAARTLGAVREVFPYVLEITPAEAAENEWPLMDTVGWQFALVAAKESPLAPRDHPLHEAASRD